MQTDSAFSNIAANLLASPTCFKNWSRILSFAEGIDIDSLESSKGDVPVNRFYVPVRK